MAIDINLAKLNKRKEEISKTEMKKVTSVGSGIPDEPEEGSCSCESIIVQQDVWETDQYRDCQCGSIWVVFGLTWG